MIKDYDCVIEYHPGRANVVADALSRKSFAALRAMNAQLSLGSDAGISVKFWVQSGLIQQVRDRQSSDPKLQNIIEQVQTGNAREFRVSSDGFLFFRDRIYLPEDRELRDLILTESHSYNIRTLDPSRIGLADPSV